MNILILGATGQLGSEVAEQLKKSEHRIFTPSRQEIDVSQSDFVAKISSYGSLDCLINATAFHDLKACEVYPDKAFQLNAHVPGILARFCSQHRMLLIHFSTDYVFDGTKGAPYLESDAPNPLNVYGQSKLLGEQKIQSVCEKYFIFRTSSLFGKQSPRGKSANLVDTFYSMAQSGKIISAVTDHMISPTHALDVALVVNFFVISNLSIYGIYHSVGSGFCSVFDLAKDVCATLGKADLVQPMCLADYPDAVKRPAFSALDNAKMRQIFPLKFWRQMVKDYLELKYGDPEK